MSRPRSSKHLVILEAIANYIEDSHYPPTLREIMAMNNISSQSVVTYYLNQLMRMGYIERTPHSARGIKITDEGKNKLDLIREMRKEKSVNGQQAST